MPYDPNKIMGLDALSPTVAAYKQFVERQNNVGDPNVVQFLASRGEPQLAGLIAKKMRVESAANAQQALAQQPPAAPPTVADQYNMAAQQQAQQEMAARMAQMQQARMAQAAPGLAGMPNPVMQQANFAGGGMVAFAGGGDVQHYANQGLVGVEPSPLTQEEQRMLDAYENTAEQPISWSPLSFLSFGAGDTGAQAMAQAQPEYIRLKQKQQDYIQYKNRLAAQEEAAKKQAGIAQLAQQAGFSGMMPAQSTVTPATSVTAPQAPSGILTLAELKDKYTPPVAAPVVRPPANTTDTRTTVRPPAPAAAAVPAYGNPYAELLSNLQADKDKGEAFYTQQALERNKQLGAEDPITKYESVLERLKDRYEGAGADKENLKQAIVKFGAALMSGKGGFNAALGQAAEAGVGGYYAGKKENEKASMDLAKSTFELDQAKTNLKLAADKEGRAEYAAKEKELEAAQLKQAEDKSKWATTVFEQTEATRRTMASIDRQVKSAEDLAIRGERSAALDSYKTLITNLENEMRYEQDPNMVTALRFKKDQYEKRLAELAAGVSKGVTGTPAPIGMPPPTGGTSTGTKDFSSWWKK